MAVFSGGGCDCDFDCDCDCDCGCVAVAVAVSAEVLRISFVILDELRPMKRSTELCHGSDVRTLLCSGDLCCEFFPSTCSGRALLRFMCGVRKDVLLKDDVKGVCTSARDLDVSRWI